MTSMIANSLARYFAGRFLLATIAVFVGIFLLVVFVDYIELMRRTANIACASALFVCSFGA